MSFTRPNLERVPDLAWSAKRGTQTAAMVFDTLTALERYEEEVASDIGQPWTVTLLPTNRILIKGAAGRMLVCYLADQDPEARLVIDDYIPELGLDLTTD